MAGGATLMTTNPQAFGGYGSRDEQLAAMEMGLPSTRQAAAVAQAPVPAAQPAQDMPVQSQFGADSTFDERAASYMTPEPSSLDKLKARLKGLINQPGQGPAAPDQAFVQRLQALQQQQAPQAVPQIQPGINPAIGY